MSKILFEIFNIASIWIYNSTKTLIYKSGAYLIRFSAKMSKQNQIKTNFGFCFWNKILNEWKVFRAKLLNTWGLNYRNLIINLGCLKVTDIKKNNSCPKFKDTRSLFERKVSTQSPYFEYDFVQNTYLHILLQFEMISCYARHK